MNKRWVESANMVRLTEAQKQYSDDRKKMVLKDVPLDVLNAPTSNGTFYSLSQMRPGLNKLNQLVERGQGYLFVDHPPDDPGKDPVPNEANLFARAGMRITELKWNDAADDKAAVPVLADINVLDTSRGRDIRACLEDGGAIGFSKRGLVGKWISRNDQQHGSVKEPTDYFLEGYDCVIGQAVRAAETRDYVLEQEQTKEQITMEIKDIKTVEDLKGLPVAVYDHVLSVAKESLKPELVAAEQTKQATETEKKVADAIKPLNEKIAALEAANAKLTSGLSKVVEALTVADLVEDREPEDVEKELRTKVETLTVENDTLKKAVETAKPVDQPVVIDGEAQATKVLENTEYKALVVESMKGAKFNTDAEFTRALEQSTAIAKRAFEVGKGSIVVPAETPVPEDEAKTKRAKEMEALIK